MHPTLDGKNLEAQAGEDTQPILQLHVRILLKKSLYNTNGDLSDWLPRVLCIGESCPVYFRTLLFRVVFLHA